MNNIIAVNSKPFGKQMQMYGAIANNGGRPGRLKREIQPARSRESFGKRIHMPRWTIRDNALACARARKSDSTYETTAHATRGRAREFFEEENRVRGGRLIRV